MREENIRVVRRSNELYLGGELEKAVDECMAPDVEWHTNWLGLPSVFHGRDGVKEWAAKVNEPMDFRDEMLDARALDDECVLTESLLTATGRGSGAPTEMKHFDLLWVREGLIYKRLTFLSEAEALEAAGASQ